MPRNELMPFLQASISLALVQQVIFFSLSCFASFSFLLPWVPVSEAPSSTDSHCLMASALLIPLDTTMILEPALMLPTKEPIWSGSQQQIVILFMVTGSFAHHVPVIILTRCPRYLFMDTCAHARTPLSWIYPSLVVTSSKGTLIWKLEVSENDQVLSRVFVHPVVAFPLEVSLVAGRSGDLLLCPCAVPCSLLPAFIY